MVGRQMCNPLSSILIETENVYNPKYLAKQDIKWLDLIFPKNGGNADVYILWSNGLYWVSNTYNPYYEALRHESEMSFVRR